MKSWRTAALVNPSLMLIEGQGLYVDVSDGSEFDSPAIGSQLAIQFDGETRYDDFETGAGSRGVYVNPTAFEAGEEVAGNVAESFNLMTQAWVYPQENNGEKQTVWQAGTEQGSVNITEDGFWQFEDLSSVGVLNCSQADGLDVPFSCEEGEEEFPVAFNEWTHLGIYRGGNGAEVYLNGELVAGNIGPDPPNHFGAFASQITIGGRDDGTNGFIGLIDDFKVQGEVSLGAHDMDFNLVPSVLGDYNENGALDAGDLDVHAQFVKDGDLAGDLNEDGKTDVEDRVEWIKTLQKSWVGDSDFNGEFNSGDLVNVFTAGKYEAQVMATYAEGDWDGSMEFDSSDLVAAFTDGGYEQGPRRCDRSRSGAGFRKSADAGWHVAAGPASPQLSSIGLASRIRAMFRYDGSERKTPNALADLPGRFALLPACIDQLEARVELLLTDRSVSRHESDVSRHDIQVALVELRAEECQ